MSDGHDRAVGVLGGMGPAATHRFLGLLIDRTPADRDQDHLRVFVDNNPAVPDRTAYLTGDGPDPRPVLLEMIGGLERSGADLLTMPCNTAHAFYDDLVAAASVPFLHMTELAIDHVVATIDGDRIGIVGTDGTMATGVYESAAADTDLTLVRPDETTQETVMAAIYGDEGIKAGYREGPRERLVGAIDTLGEVDAVIAGCTEIPLALRDEDVDVPLIDPMVVMADAAIELARGEAD